MKNNVILLAALLLTTGAVVAQGTLSPSTEFTVSTLQNCDFDNVVVTDGSTPYTIDFSAQTSIGNGTYGPMYPQGTDYMMEAFWTNATGLTNGHMHFSSSGGNPGAWEDHHTQGTDRQGFRITRVDGMPFQILSIDYRNSDTDLEIVSAPFTDTANFVSQATVYGATEGFITSDPNWLTYMFASPVAVDAAPTAIISPMLPGTCSLLGSSENITIEITNFGNMPLPSGSQINVSYSINGNPTVSEVLTLASVVPTFTTVNHTFAFTEDLSSLGTYNFTVSASAVGDLNTGNDTYTESFSSGGFGLINAFPWTENFDGFGAFNGSTTPPVGWEQDQADATGTGGNGDWIFNNLPAGSGNGPYFDQSGAGFFAHTSDFGNHSEVNLTTPCIDLTGLNNPVFTFYVHSFDSSGGNNENFLHVDAITYPGASIIPDVIPPIGHIGNRWEFVQIDLSAFINTTIQVRFRSETDGGSSTHDIGIDSLSIFEPQFPGTGEDFRLTAGINSANDLSTESVVIANFGDVLFANVSSPNGTFNTEAPVITGQFYSTGAPAPFVSIFGGDGLWIDPFASPGPVIVFDGAAPPLGGIGLPPSGLTFQFPVGPGLSGFSFMMNAFSITSLAANTIFVGSEGIEIRFI